MSPTPKLSSMQESEDNAMSKIATNSKRDWTVLVYQGNGCQGKHAEHHSDLLELQKLPASDRVSILTQGHKNYSEDILERREIKPLRGRYKPVEPLHTVVGRQNQPEQLANFIRWGMKNYPAKRTCLVISGFGGGNNGMIADESGGLMPLTDIRTGLENGLQGNELDVLAFDGHWMSCVEAAAEFEETSGLMVASQGRKRSWDYEDKFSELLKHPDIYPDTLAFQFVDADEGKSGMSVLDLAEVPNVMYRTEVLLQASDNYGLDKEILEESEGVAHFKDLKSIIDQFAQPDVPGAIRKLAGEAQMALSDLTLDHATLPEQETGGVSVATLYDDREDGREFRKWTSWDKFLTAQSAV